MRNFIGDVVIPMAIVLGLLLGGIGAILGLSIANAHWNCTQWTRNTGENTQVMAGECYVRSGARWELFDTYIRHHHVAVESGE